MGLRRFITDVLCLCKILLILRPRTHCNSIAADAAQSDVSVSILCNAIETISFIWFGHDNNSSPLCLPLLRSSRLRWVRSTWSNECIGCRVLVWHVTKNFELFRQWESRLIPVTTCVDRSPALTKFCCTRLRQELRWNRRSKPLAQTRFTVLPSQIRLSSVCNLRAPYSVG